MKILNISKMSFDQIKVAGKADPNYCYGDINGYLDDICRLAELDDNKNWIIEEDKLIEYFQFTYLLEDENE